jgi:hypothetical protein
VSPSGDASRNEIEDILKVSRKTPTITALAMDLQDVERARRSGIQPAS